MIDCRDILDAVYYHVKEIYISHFYSSKVKRRSLSDDQNDVENLKMTSSMDPETRTNVNSRQSVSDVIENVEEKNERVDESEVRLDIRHELEMKMPYALASVCSNLAKLDRMYRELKGFDEQPEFSEYHLDVGDSFPLSDRFVFPCVMYVCSMALIDVDEDKSDDFFDKYATSVASISMEVPYKSGETVEKYPY